MVSRGGGVSIARIVIFAFSFFWCAESAGESSTTQTSESHVGVMVYDAVCSRFMSVNIIDIIYKLE